jgi:hypothetical protein
MSLQIRPSFNITTRLSGAAIEDSDQVSLSQLRDVAAGRDSSFSRTHAIALLFESDFPNTHRDLQQILENDRESSELRHLAAVYLGKLNVAASQEILLGSLSIRDDFVLSGVVKALGWTGDERGFDALARLDGKVGERTAAELRFATMLIAHRLGLAGAEPAKADYLELGAGAGRSLSLVRVDRNEAELCLRGVGRHPLGIEYDEASMCQLRCGRNVWMLAFNRDVVGQGGVQKLRARKWVIGAVALKNRVSGLYVPAYLILASPSDSGLTILVHRLNGVVAFGGTAGIEDGKVRFSLRAAARPGAFAVRLEGTLEAGRLKMSTAVASARIAVPKRRVEPLAADSSS